jgi:hypothetical protein
VPLTLPKRDAKKPNVISRLARQRRYSRTLADKIAANLPPDQREQFKRMMTADLDIAALSKAMTDAMVKDFTTEELKALADFYGSPVGKSAMQKFGTYMADIMPVMQAEIIKASAKLNQSMPNQSPK